MQIPTLEDPSPGARPIITDVFRGGGQEGSAKIKAQQAMVRAVSQIAKTFQAGDKISSKNRVDEAVEQSREYLQDKQNEVRNSGLGGTDLLQHFSTSTPDWDKIVNEYDFKDDKERQKAKNAVLYIRNNLRQQLQPFSLISSRINQENEVKKSMYTQVKSITRNGMPGSIYFRPFIKNNKLHFDPISKVEGDIDSNIRAEYRAEITSRSKSALYRMEGFPEGIPTFEEWFDQTKYADPKWGQPLIFDEYDGKVKFSEEIIPEVSGKDSLSKRNKEKIRQLKTAMLFRAALDHLTSRLATANTTAKLEALDQVVPVNGIEGSTHRGVILSLTETHLFSSFLDANRKILDLKFIGPDGKETVSLYEQFRDKLTNYNIAIEAKKYSIFKKEGSRLQDEYDGVIDNAMALYATTIRNLTKTHFSSIGKGTKRSDINKLQTKFAVDKKNARDIFSNSIEQFDSKGRNLSQGVFLDRSKRIDKSVSNSYEADVMTDIMKKVSKAHLSNSNIKTIRRLYMKGLLKGNISMEAAMRIRKFSFDITDFRMDSAFRKGLSAVGGKLLSRMGLDRGDLNSGTGKQIENYYTVMEKIIGYAKKDNFQKSPIEYYNDYMTGGSSLPGKAPSSKPGPKGRPPKSEFQKLITSSYESAFSDLSSVLKGTTAEKKWLGYYQTFMDDPNNADDPRIYKKALGKLRNLTKWYRSKEREITREYVKTRGPNSKNLSPTAREAYKIWFKEDESRERIETKLKKFNRIITAFGRELHQLHKNAASIRIDQ